MKTQQVAKSVFVYSLKWLAVYVIVVFTLHIRQFPISVSRRSSPANRFSQCVALTG